jgi:hypothetical protein
MELVYIVYGKDYLYVPGHYSSKVMELRLPHVQQRQTPVLDVHGSWPPEPTGTRSTARAHMPHPSLHEDALAGTVGVTGDETGHWASA